MSHGLVGYTGSGMADNFNKLSDADLDRAKQTESLRRGVRRGSFSGIPSTSVLRKKSTSDGGGSGGGSKARRQSRIDPLLLWTKLHVRYAGQEKAAISTATGHVQRGTFTALLGPAGSGKTTLLQCLAGRLPSDVSVTGSAAVRGKPMDSERMKTMSSYVADEDLFLPHLETLESLFFVARMRVRTAKMSDGALTDLCMLLLEELGLADKANVMVGGELSGGLNVRGLSDGQRRRLSLGCGLVSKPTLIFADEPTSGLDASSSLSVMQVMHDLAANANLGIICTAHRPRHAVWQMFDQVCLLSEGRSCYFGPASGCVPWFTSLGYLLEDVVMTGNPADTCVDLISINHYKAPELFGKNTMLDDDDVKAAANAFDAAHRSQISIQVLAVMGEEPERFAMDRAVEKSVEKWLGVAGFYDSWDSVLDFARQYRVLTKRTMESHTRNKGNALARNVLMNVVAVIAAGVFGNQHRRSIKLGKIGDYVGEDLTSYYGGLFSWLVFTALMAYVPIGCIQYDRTFFLKERKAGLYSTAAWYCAYMSVETYIITTCSLSCGILYAQLMGFVRCWSVAVRPFGLQLMCQLKYAVYFGAICNGLSLLFSQILMLSVAVSRNLNVAFMMAMGVFLHGFITSGFPVDLGNLNPEARWLQYTSVFHYPYDACQRMLLGNENATDQGFEMPMKHAVIFDIVVMYGSWALLHIPTFYAFVYWSDRADERYSPEPSSK